MPLVAGLRLLLRLVGGDKTFAAKLLFVAGTLGAFPDENLRAGGGDLKRMIKNKTFRKSLH